MEQKETLTERLVRITEELDARERSCNLIYDDLSYMSYKTLCYAAKDIVEELIIGLKND